MTRAGQYVFKFSDRAAKRFVVSDISKYLKVRGYMNGPLFTFDGSPISQSFYTKELHNALSFIGLDINQYKPHRFRIGAARCAFQCKIPQEKIRLMGRWKSDAVYRYFRIPVFDVMDIFLCLPTRGILG
jgi:hypothetical protein